MPPRRHAARRVPRPAAAARARRRPARARTSAGDDARRIDWNLTARSLSPQVRTTEADRELQTWLVVDRSPSMDFGTARTREARRSRSRPRRRSASSPPATATVSACSSPGAIESPGSVRRRPAPRSSRRCRACTTLPRGRRPGDRRPIADALVELDRTRPRRGQIIVRLRLPRRRRIGSRRSRRLAFASPGVVRAGRRSRASSCCPPSAWLTLVDTETGRRLHVQSNCRRRSATATRRRRRERHESIGARDSRTPAPNASCSSTDRDWLIDIVRFVAGRRTLRGRGGAGLVHQARRPHLAAVGAPQGVNSVSFASTVATAADRRRRWCCSVAYLLAQRSRRKYALRFTSVDLLASVAPRRPGWQRHISAALMLVALVALVVGLAEPTGTTKVARQRGTVMLAIDTSGSMAGDRRRAEPARGRPSRGPALRRRSSRRA